MCSTLSDPDNGIVITDKMNMKGSIATYVCDFGYMLVGNRQRLCQGTLSDWNGTAPICQRKNNYCTMHFLLNCTCIISIV